MKAVTTSLEKFQYFYPYTVALVGAKTAEHTNFMACAWHTALSFNPPLFGILVAKKRLTHRVITEAGEFSVNFLGREDIQLSAQMGRISGHDRDKIQEFQVKLAPSRLIQSPILETAYAAMECRLQETRSFGDHDLFIGEVVAVHQEEGSFDGNGVLDPAKVKPLLYLGGDFYTTTVCDPPVHQLPQE
jgi:flavin reductase (DIM6/NTAB) family NADH-FMN oxidoreductase RutF